MMSKPEVPDPSGWGVLHEWLEHGEVRAYLFGPLPSKRSAELVLGAFGCDCNTSVIPVSFPAGIAMGPSSEVIPAPPGMGSPHLPERLH
jgi:hypothetical protein